MYLFFCRFIYDPLDSFPQSYITFLSPTAIYIIRSGVSCDYAD